MPLSIVLLSKSKPTVLLHATKYSGSEPTDITSVKANETEAAAYYDLSGRRMSGKPTEKGIYVKDGKKILVK